MRLALHASPPQVLAIFSVILLYEEKERGIFRCLYVLCCYYCRQRDKYAYFLCVHGLMTPPESWGGRCRFRWSAVFPHYVLLQARFSTSKPPSILSLACILNECLVQFIARVVVR